MAEPGPETVAFRVVFKKQTYQVEFGLDKTVKELKEHLAPITGCPVVSQKLMFKGALKDGDTLRARKFTPKAKLLLIGPTPEDVMAIATMGSGVSDADGDGPGAAEGGAAAEESWCSQTQHRKVLAKGKPADAEMGYVPIDGPEPLPQTAIMLFNANGKVRLAFKLEQGMMVVSTNSSQKQVPLSSIHDCKSQPIEENPAYHILAVQLGPTSKSTAYFYWVPAQYIPTIVALLSK